MNGITLNNRAMTRGQGMEAFARLTASDVDALGLPTEQRRALVAWEDRGYRAVVHHVPTGGIVLMRWTARGAQDRVGILPDGTEYGRAAA